MLQQRYTPPAQRDVTARMFTTAGWINGIFMIPKLRTFVEFLNNQQHDFFKLKDVSLPGLDKVIPFFALQRSTLIFLIPEFESDLFTPPAGGERVTRDVSCALSTGVISGSLDILAGVRVSDFLMSKANFFFPLTKCTTFLRAGGQADVTRDIPVVIVNAPQVLGVAEPRFI